jgi:uncharacterized protein YdaU (DUF1376 family)
MSFAYMPFYTGDYLRDTRHLSPLKHGIYVLLLMHCWDTKGPLPLDEPECAGIANCRSQDEVESLRYILQRFFTKGEDGWYNNRMQREIERCEALSEKRKLAGAKGFQALAGQMQDKSQASAGHVPLHQPHTIPRPKTPPTPPAESTPKKAGGDKDFKYPKIPPYIHDEWIDREFKAGRLKLRYGETYEDVRRRLIAERETSK